MEHSALLERVSLRLATKIATTDQLLLTRWRVLGLCQLLIGGAAGQAETVVVGALDLFAREGTTNATDAALKNAASVAERSAVASASSVLPHITSTKQQEVRTRLQAYEALGPEAIEQALRTLPALRGRLQRSTMGALLAGIRHRIELVAAVAGDGDRPLAERLRASSAILYVDEIHDAIPDSLGQIGLLDDDFALRAVLGETGGYSDSHCLHWAERISALWDDLPFLRGVRLCRGQEPVPTTWLDRINSFVAYTDALSRTTTPLVLVQPSIACSPLHPIISLIGLLVLEGLTSSRNLLQSLCVGHVYEIDGQHSARYEGTLDGPPAPGWLRLRFRDGVIYRPPTLADRMVATPECRLSSARTFTEQVTAADAEPIQRFFDWDEAIGAASLTSRVLLVTSRDRANQLLADISSNGVSLLDDGLVKFAGTSPSPDVIRSGLVLVVPTLAVARHTIEQGLTTHAIVIDGYERLHRGRHELPFLGMGSSPPSMIVWSAAGYFPDVPPGWLQKHRLLQVDPTDLEYILELDGDLADDSLCRASLWEAATSSGLEKVPAPWTPEEQELLASIDTNKPIVDRRKCKSQTDEFVNSQNGVDSYACAPV